jgi:hypothetical protein
MITDRTTRLAIVVMATALLALSPGLAIASDEPGDARARADALARDTGADTVWRQTLIAAIEADPDCDSDTTFRQWVDTQIAPISPTTLDVLGSYGVFDWAYFWSLGGDQDASDEYIGIDGQYTTEVQRRHRQNQHFWDVATDDVLLQGMHGEAIADDAKMVPLVSFVFGIDAPTAQAVVDLVQATIEGDPGIDYDNPIFTLNAFAFSGEIPGLPPIPDKIVLGDGLLVGFQAIGLGDVAPDYVHAHEFAHQVQEEVGVFEGFDPSPEATRRTELMADAFGAYEVAHVRGATFRTKRLVQAVAAGFNSGDCAFDNDNHHGTPEQRAAAIDWGISVAAANKPRAVVVPSTELVARFDAALPVLVAVP